MLQHIFRVSALAVAIGVAQPLFAAEFEPIWDTNKIVMVSEKLADGVYAFYGKDTRELNTKGGAAATSAGLIVGTRGALLIDTLLNQRLSQQVQKLSQEITKMPIGFAVNTSAHGDHSYGNMYLPAATLVVQHVNTKQYVDQHLADDKAFMIKNFGANRGIEEITARTGDILVPALGKVTLDLGGKSIDIIDFGFGQTGGDLFVWDAQAKVMWAGNVIIAGKPALPWLLDGHLLETLATLNLDSAVEPVARATKVPKMGEKIVK